MAVNLSPVGGVAAQFFDNNGNPLTGGKIYTYAAGTTTNQTTYTSSAGTSAHTNPIILDSAGRVPGGEIWLTDGLQYKFVIKNANDVTIGTYDNIIGINSNFVNFFTETEVQTATAGQTVFTLTTMQYQPGTNNLTVYVDGVNQIDGSSYSYVETSSTVVTFTAGLHVGALVKFTTAQTLSTGVTDASLVTYDPPFTASVTTTVENKFAEAVSVKDFGAVGDGITDDTAAIQAALNYGASSARTVYFPDGIYRANTLVANCSVDMSKAAQIKYNGAENGFALEISTTSKQIGFINVDGNGKNVTPVNLSGSQNSVDKIVVSNVIATVAGGVSFCGVRLTGDDNNINEIEVDDFVNSGHPNGSFPQAVLAFGADNRILSIIVRNGQSGLVCSTNVSTSVGSITTYNMSDNGIYQLAGYLNVGCLNYYGTEEPVVFIGSADVESIFVKGTALGVGFQNCGNVNINHLHVDEDSSGNSPLFLFRIRATSTSCGRVSFNSITGKFKGSTLFASNVGTAEFLTINNMNVQFMYDAAVATNLSSWADITAFSGFRISNGYVEVTDIANVLAGQTFNMTVNAAVSKSSFLHDLDVQLYNSNGTTEANASFRGINFAQRLIETRGIQWRTDIGPYVVGSTLTSGVDDTANAIPTAGAWKRGKRLNEAFPASGGTEGWVCVLAGTPGTWKTFGVIS